MPHPTDCAWELREERSSLGTYSTGIATVTIKTPKSPQGSPKRHRSICFPELAHLTSQNHHSDVTQVSLSTAAGLGYRNPLARNLGKDWQCMNSSSQERRTLFSMCWGLMGNEEELQLKLSFALCLCAGQSPPFLPSDTSDSQEFV